MTHKPRIKIAQVITRMDRGGSPDVIRMICAGLDPARFDVTFVTGPSVHLSDESNRFLEQFKNRTVFLSDLVRDIHPAKDMRVFQKLRDFFGDMKFDIVHTHTAKAGALGRLAARWSGVPHVVHTPHGHNFYGYFGPLGSRMVVWIERYLAGHTSRIIGLTELEKRDFVHYGVCRPDQVEVIQGGLELDRFHRSTGQREPMREEFGIPQDAFLVGLVSRLEPVKGPGIFVEAVPSILEAVPGARFLIAGDGSLRSGLEIRCQNLGICDRVLFTGWREDIPEILSTLDVLALPSLNEAVGRVLLEAGACGIPAIASDVGGVAEVVCHHETGLLVQPASAQALAAAVIQLARDEGMRKKFGAAARYWVDEKFSQERMIERLTALYLDLVDKD